MKAKSIKYREQNKEYYIKNKEKILAYHRKWYSKNKQKNLERKKVYYQANKARFLEGQQKYYIKNKERILGRFKEYYQKNKIKLRVTQNNYSNDARREYRFAIFKILGLKCRRCGFEDFRALQIDHINGGGRKEARSTSGLGYYKLILQKVIAGSKDYQILCANCNWIKVSENNEHPYKKIL